MISDRDLMRVIEGSAIFRAIDRFVSRLVIGFSHSRLVPQIKYQAKHAAAHRGATLLTAVAVHVLLVATLGRPMLWYWLILPALFAVAGLLLLLMVDSKAARRG